MDQIIFGPFTLSFRDAPEGLGAFWRAGLPKITTSAGLAIAWTIATPRPATLVTLVQESGTVRRYKLLVHPDEFAVAARMMATILRVYSVVAVFEDRMGTIAATVAS